MISALLLVLLTAPQPTVTLVPGLGETPAVFELGPSGGLRAHLERRGFTVLTVTPTGDTIEAMAADLSTHLTASSSPYAIGHGVGGAALYLAAGRTPTLRAVVGIGAPVAFGGESRAARRLYAQPATTDWAAAGTIQLAGRPLSKLLMTVGLTPATRARFFQVAAAPLRGPLLRHLGARCPRCVTPQPGPVFAALRDRADLAVLSVISMHDGLTPSWQADPARFGLRRANTSRHYVTRVDGAHHQYNHLDLLLGDGAHDDIFSPITAWLVSRQSRP